MKVTKYFLVVVLLLFLNSCKDKTTNPPDDNNNNPPGYQEDVDWPSLADSPWPMYHHDPQYSGRSDFPGPENGMVNWDFQLYYSQAGISIGSDSLIFAVSMDSLFSINPDGSLNYKINLGEFPLNTPLITSEGYIYTGYKNKIIKINSSGNILWEFDCQGNYETMLNIDKTGNLYAVDRNKVLYCISPEGELLWTYTDNRFQINLFGMPFSPDGNVLYITGGDNSSFAPLEIIAFDVSKRDVIWSYRDSLNVNAPIIDANGRIYLLTYDFNLYSNGYYALNVLNKYGELLWEKYIFYESSTNHNLPALDKDGNIYVASDSLYSFNYEGNLNWKTDITGFSDCPLIIDVNSNIYTGTYTPGQIHLMKFDKNGNLIWSFSDDQDQIGGSPAIGYNNSVIFPTWRSNKLYYFK